MAPKAFDRLVRRWKVRTPITAIGEIVARGFTIVEGGVERRAQPRGFQHR
jgi:hypothetical protein